MENKTGFSSTDATNVKGSFSEKLIRNLGHEPTKDQQKLADMFSDFLKDPATVKTFLLRGYAGTGKTTFINALSKSLPAFNFKVVLLAPTGRAAKVMNTYTGQEAFTIHKRIYAMEGDADGGISVRLNLNSASPNTAYIVDEASMISSGVDRSDLFGNRSLLDDLFTYVYNKPGCLLVLSGDTAQLPPVSETESRSLDPEYIKTFFNSKVYSFEMKEVVRQARESGILMNATALRILVGRKEQIPVLKTEGFEDVDVLYSSDISDRMQDHFGSRFDDEVLVVCRSNKQANKYNQYIRSSILAQEEEISSGDSMMVVKNNYFWLPEESKAGFIANGDIIRIKRITKTEERFGCRFAHALIRLVDYDEEPGFEVMLLLNTLYAEAPALGKEESKNLFNAIAQTYVSKKTGKIAYKKVFKDPYLNALQVKFSYAVTCHKAQGGQWNEVFVDAGYMTEEMYNTEFLRWLYTAVTRAKKKLYFVNMNDKFFKK